MPRYFFDLYDGVSVTPDMDGIDLVDDNEARKEAIAAFSDLAGELFIRDQQVFTVDVRTASREVIYTATCSLVGRWLKSIDPSDQAERVPEEVASLNSISHARSILN